MKSDYDTIRRPLCVLLAACLLAAASGCAPYNAPPEPELTPPEGGAFLEGQSLDLEFTEPIDPSTLSVRIWPNDRGPEGNFADGVEPLVDTCTPADSPCGDLTIELADDDTSATLTLGGDLGKAGTPLSLEVEPGLADPQGNDTGVSHYFDFQFRIDETANTDPVQFDDGVYVLGASVQKPLPAVLTLVSDIKVLDDGTFALAGTSAKVKDGAERTSINPDDIYVRDDDHGWTVYAVGQITVKDDGTRLLETDPFNAYVPLGTITIHLDQVRLFATVKKDPDTNKDTLDGTLSFEQIRLTYPNGNETTTDGGSTALRGKFVPEDKIPAGYAQLCGDLCGAVIGHCEPPDNFPPDGICTDTTQ